jgi:hypothetical protein
MKLEYLIQNTKGAMQDISKILKNAVIYIIYFLGMQSMYLLNVS